MNLINKALEIAFECHKNQKRKANNAPYIVHILDVARLLMSEPSASENVIAAGILHDTLEDTSYNAGQLQKDFGSDILELVLFVTEPEKDNSTSKEQKRQNWKERKQHTIDICQAATKDQFLIVLADKLSNMNSIKDDMVIMGNKIWSYFNAPKDDIYWYYHELETIFNQKISDSRLVMLYNQVLKEVFSA